MSDFRESGATPRAWFPRAWAAYDGLVAGCGLILMVVNALIGVDVFPATVDRWISVGIAALTAVLIWLRLRATQLGVAKVNKQEEPETPSAPKEPGKP